MSQQEPIDRYIDFILEGDNSKAALVLLNSCYSSDEYEDLLGVEQDGEMMRAMLLPAGYSVSWTE